MDLAGEYTFDAPKQMVWDAVRDPDVLGSILPGGAGIKEIAENEFEGMLKMKVGPVQGKFKGNIKLSDIVPPDSYSIEVNGKGAPGFVKGGGGLVLTDQGDTTLMVYKGTAQVGGKIASVGQRLLDASAKSIVNQSLVALNEYLKHQVAAQNAPAVVAEPEAPAAAVVETVTKTVEQTTTTVAGNGVAKESVKAKPASPPPPPPSTPIPEYKPPSQTEFAMGVAKEIFEDVVPEPYRPIAISVLTTLVTMFVLRLFGRKK